MDFEGFVGSKFERNVTNVLPHKALQLIVWGKSNFDERVVVHLVVSKIIMCSKFHDLTGPLGEQRYLAHKKLPPP